MKNPSWRTPLENVAPLAVRWLRRWDETRQWMALGLVFIPVGERLLSRYSEPGRHYHDGRHILSCLTALDAYGGVIRNTDAVEIALWFHDAIYDTGSTPGDNRTKSALYFRSELQSLAADLIDIAAVERLILATRHGAEPEDGDAAVIMDIDLGILAADPARYRFYAEDIRKEYAHIDEPSFRAWRAAVLRSHLKRKSIYWTRHFRKLLDANARRNILAELRSLDA